MDGPIPVSRFVERALYDPEAGFYETGGRAGRRGGSFITSPEVGPLFGAVVSRALDAWWREAGEPQDWIVVDAGAGPGTLARAILAAEPACGPSMHLVCVERSAAQRDLHPSGVDSRADLPAAADVILANELLDNLPFDLVERTPAGWRYVAVDATGSTTPDTGGVRVPVVDRAVAWVGGARRRLRPGGRLVCFDYASTTAELARRPWTDWLRAFAGHERVDDVFAPAGRRDITIVVPVDQLPARRRDGSQAGWLGEHGIDDLVAEGARIWTERAASPDLDAIRMRSRTTEAGALLDPDGLGGFWVGEWGPAPS